MQTVEIGNLSLPDEVAFYFQNKTRERLASDGHYDLSLHWSREIDREKDTEPNEPINFDWALWNDALKKVLSNTLANYYIRLQKMKVNTKNQRARLTRVANQRAKQLQKSNALTK